MTHGLSLHPSIISKRFRGFLPVVIDVETAGLNPETDALLEIAAVILDINEAGVIYPTATHACHVFPFEGANLDQKALEFINVHDPYHPFRFAVSEKEALDLIFKPIREALRKTKCHRAVLVGHNAFFDLSVLQAAMRRTDYKKNPFHRFTTFDTATLSALALGHTVLAVATKKAGISFHVEEAHCAIYDAEKTAELFCHIVNRWDRWEKLEKESSRTT